MGGGTITNVLRATVKGVYDGLYFIIENNITMVPKVENHTDSEQDILADYLRIKAITDAAYSHLAQQ